MSGADNDRALARRIADEIAPELNRRLLLGRFNRGELTEAQFQAGLRELVEEARKGTDDEEAS